MLSVVIVELLLLLVEAVEVDETLEAGRDEEVDVERVPLDLERVLAVDARVLPRETGLVTEEVVDFPRL